MTERATILGLPREQVQSGLDQLLEHARARATNSVDALMELIVRDEKGQPVRQHSLHRVFQAHVDFCWRRGLYAGIRMPFAHGKTFQTIGRIAWTIGRDTNERWKVVSASEDVAKQRLMAVGNLIENPLYRWAFPHVRRVEAPVDPNSSGKRKTTKGRTEFSNSRLYVARSGFSLDPTVGAYGVLSGGTGGRATKLLFDDAVDLKNSILNPGLRIKVAEAIENTWLSRLEPGGKVLYLTNPWHEADFSYQILSLKGWCVLDAWVSEDKSRLELGVWQPPSGYPFPLEDGSYIL